MELALFNKTGKGKKKAKKKQKKKTEESNTGGSWFFI